MPHFVSTSLLTRDARWPLWRQRGNGQRTTDNGNGYGDSGKAIGATKAQKAILQGNATVYQCRDLG